MNVCSISEGDTIGRIITNRIDLPPERQSRARNIGALALRPPGMTEVETEVMTRTVTDRLTTPQKTFDRTTPAEEGERSRV
jgi:hypothetical protein